MDSRKSWITLLFNDYIQRLMLKYSFEALSNEEDGKDLDTYADAMIWKLHSQYEYLVSQEALQLRRFLLVPGMKEIIDKKLLQIDDIITCRHLKEIHAACLVEIYNDNKEAWKESGKPRLIHLIFKGKNGYDVATKEEAREIVKDPSKIDDFVKTHDIRLWGGRSQAITLFNDEGINQELKKAFKEYGLDKVEKRIDSVNIDKLKAQNEIYNTYAMLLNEYLKLEEKEKNLRFIYDAPDANHTDMYIEKLWQGILTKIADLKDKIFSPQRFAPLSLQVQEKASEQTRYVMIEFLRSKVQELAASEVLSLSDFEYILMKSMERNSSGKLVHTPHDLFLMLHDRLEQRTYVITNPVKVKRDCILQ